MSWGRASSSLRRSPSLRPGSPPQGSCSRRSRSGTRCCSSRSARPPAMRWRPAGTPDQATTQELDMRLAPGLHRLGNGLVNSYLVEEGGAITVVDAGMSGQYADLEAELRA